MIFLTKCFVRLIGSSKRESDSWTLPDRAETTLKMKNLPTTMPITAKTNSLKEYRVLIKTQGHQCLERLRPFPT
jgi:hypothetical protein